MIKYVLIGAFGAWLVFTPNSINTATEYMRVALNTVASSVEEATEKSTVDKVKDSVQDTFNRVTGGG